MCSETRRPRSATEIRLVPVHGGVRCETHERRRTEGEDVWLPESDESHSIESFSEPPHKFVFGSAIPGWL